MFNPHLHPTNFLFFPTWPFTLTEARWSVSRFTKQTFDNLPVVMMGWFGGERYVYIMEVGSEALNVVTTYLHSVRFLQSEASKKIRKMLALSFILRRLKIHSYILILNF